MIEFAAKFSEYRYDLQEKLAERQRDFSDSESLPEFRRRVKEFCNLDPPTTEEEMKEILWQHIKLAGAISASWRSLDRIRQSPPDNSP